MYRDNLLPAAAHNRLTRVGYVDAKFDGNLRVKLKYEWIDGCLLGGRVADYSTSNFLSIMNSNLYFNKSFTI